MNKNNSAILKLIKAGLLSEKCDLEGDLDWNYIQVACYRQGITNLVYQAVKNSSVKIPTDNLRLFQAEALSELKISPKDIAKSIYDKYNDWNIKYLERRVSFDNKIVKLRENFRLSQEQFAENVKNRFNNDSYLRRRLIESFPNLTIKMPKMKGRKKN